MRSDRPRGVRLLAVLGPSGSGKSSVVLAGLVPRLQEEAIDGSQGWKIVILRPGDDPLKHLAAEVISRLGPAEALTDVGHARRLIDELQADERTLDLFARMVLGDASADARLGL